ncbi:hypothetical protein BOTBODRAFT_182386, partial [Botryobasidium botryosum FD-172 SS1]
DHVRTTTPPAPAPPAPAPPAHGGKATPALPMLDHQVGTAEIMGMFLKFAERLWDDTFSDAEAVSPLFRWEAIAKDPDAYLTSTSVPPDVKFHEDGTLDRADLFKLYAHVYEGQGLEPPLFAFLSEAEIIKYMKTSGVAEGGSHKSQEGEGMGGVDRAASTNGDESENSHRGLQTGGVDPLTVEAVAPSTSATGPTQGEPNANEEDPPAAKATTPDPNVTGAPGGGADASAAKAKTPSLGGDNPDTQDDQVEGSGTESQVGTQLEADRRPKPRPKRGKAKEAGEVPQLL